MITLKKRGPCTPFDARHLDICSRAGAGNIGCESRRLRTAGKVLGQRLDDLRGSQNAEVKIRQQGENAAAFSWRMVENDSAGIRDPCKCGSDDAVAALDIVMAQSLIYLPREGGCEPFGREAGRRDESMTTAGLELTLDDGGKVGSRRFHDLGAVLSQPSRSSDGDGVPYRANRAGYNRAADLRRYSSRCA